MRPDLPSSISVLCGSDQFADVIRVTLALIGVVVFSLFSGHHNAIVSLILGVIACALAETDDNGIRRLISLSVTLICFFSTSLIVEILAAWPPLFALGLVSSTFLLVMLGAASVRWGAVATSTLILAVYTMIGTEQVSVSHDWVSLPLYLTAGAAWYGALSFFWGLVAPMNAVRFALASVFDALAVQHDCVAALFAPCRETDYDAARLKLANANSAVVTAMNAARRALLNRVGRIRLRNDTEEKLRLYFAAQDMHERIHSAHYPHEALAKAFFHSDLLFRCAHLLHMQGDSLRGLADSLRHRASLPDAQGARKALEELQSALEFVCRNGSAETVHIEAVRALLRNMEALQSALEQPEKMADTVFVTGESGMELQNPDAVTPHDFVLRILANLTSQSATFRHAVRLSLGLLSGYAFLLLFHLPHGFWILLTTLFVSQQSYGATRKRLFERILGTVVGIVLGWATLQLFPLAVFQLPLIVLAGVGFFAFRRHLYMVATAMITLLVVLCFEQVLSGYAVLWPRLFDTLVGVVISFLTLRFVLPDWSVPRVQIRLADVIDADARYLQAIMHQYRTGRSDDLSYRIARRDAHNAHAAFDGVIRDMLSEPGQDVARNDSALRALGLVHQLLSGLSAMGAHRAATIVQANDPLQLCQGAVSAQFFALGIAVRRADFSSLSYDEITYDVGGHTILRRFIGGHLRRLSLLCREISALAPALI